MTNMAGGALIVVAGARDSNNRVSVNDLCLVAELMLIYSSFQRRRYQRFTGYRKDYTDILDDSRPLSGWMDCKSPPHF